MCSCAGFAGPSGLRLPLCIICGVVLLLAAGCTPLVNYFAFHPSRLPASYTPPPGFTNIFFDARDGVRLHALLSDSGRGGKVVVYFHGNAGTIADRIPALQTIAARGGVRVLGVSYRGYGLSRGRPGEAGLYRDAEAALAFVRDSLGCVPESTIVMGRSLGTAPGLHAALHAPVGGLILITPLSSAREQARVMGLGLLAPLAGTAFDLVSRISSLTAPLLIVHGTDDEVLPYWMGRKVFDHASGPRAFVTIRGGRHNDLEYRDSRLFWSEILEFLEHPHRGN